METKLSGSFEEFCSQKQKNTVLSNSLKVQPGFQVKYTLKPCQFGLGLFADQLIQKGQLVWKYGPGTNILCLTSEESVRQHLASLPTHKSRQEFLEYAYHKGPGLNYILDDGKYFNHSESPTTLTGYPGKQDTMNTYALQDIDAGEELCEDYGTYEHPEWCMKLYKEYDVPLDYFTITQ